MDKNPEVIKTDIKIKVLAPKIPIQNRLLRVAAYTRVSAQKDAMHHSLAAQISYYNSYIQNHSGWLFCGVYSDEAKTGTKVTRDGFQELLAEARAGKIDLIITKSISRFARNTLALLEIVRELKALGIGIFFEEQNINTLDGSGELMMTILGSFAQEESLSVSENQKWRVRKNFEEGKPWNCTVFGYRAKNGVFIPEEPEASAVKLIFEMYINGCGTRAIADMMNALGFVTRQEKRWSHRSVTTVLENRIYTGELLLQKSFSSDHITKRKVVNRGEKPMYRVENAHEPLISKEMFENVQKLIAEKAELNRGGKYIEPTVFTEKITCGCCGKKYRRKKNAAGWVWVCRTFNSSGKKACPEAKQIPEKILIAETEKISPAFDFTEITVTGPNRLLFHFPGGAETEIEWKDRSRAESWTPEMKEKARAADAARRMRTYG